MQIRVIHILCFWLFTGQAWAAENWYWKGGVELLAKGYNDSMKLHDLTGIGGMLSGDYMERGGFVVSYNVNHINYQSNISSDPKSIDEAVLMLGGRFNFHPDGLPGRVTLRLDGYRENDDMHYRVSGSGSSKKIVTIRDRVVGVNPVASFLNYTKTFYADVGYAYTHYHSDDSAVDDVNVRQWAPTLGFGLNRSYDWLQLRAYLISLSASNRVADKDITSALEVKWSHWFTADVPLDLHSARLAAVVGKRIYAVDSDASTMFSVSDLQTGAISIAMEWRLGDQISTVLQGGYESYEELLSNDRYNSVYMYVSVSQSW